MRRNSICERPYGRLFAEMRHYSERNFQQGFSMMSPRTPKDHFDRRILDNPPAVAAEDSRAFSISRFCKRYGIGRSKVYDEIKARRLIARKVGRRTIIREQDAENWLRSLPAVGNSSVVSDAGRVVAAAHWSQQLRIAR